MTAFGPERKGLDRIQHGLQRLRCRGSAEANYWRDLPLRLKPSVAELAAQAEKADSAEKRLRYAMILELIEREIPMVVH